MAKSKSAALKGGSAKDFSGGPNLRDAASQITANECIDSFNITFDERGGASSRLGYARYNSTVYHASDLIRNQFWSGIVDTVIVQCGAKLYLGTSNTVNKTFATTARAVFAEFNGKIYAGHPVDGLFHSTDAVTWTAVADADRPTTCVAIAVWQNKLWVVPANSDTVYWSSAGDGTSWVNTDFNALREKDNEPLVGLHISSGQDVLGRPGLLAFKQESTYRINNSTTGAYDTVDATVGAANHIAIVGVGPKVFAVSKRGIFWFQEGLAGMQNASDRLQPLWDPSQIDLTQLDLFAAGRKRNRAVFSLPRTGSTANDLSLELHPDQAWIAPGSNAMSCYTVSTGAAEVLYGGHPTTTGRLYAIDSGGLDDSADIDWRLQTQWFNLNNGFGASVWQIRLHGRGEGTLTVMRNYASSGGDDRAFDLTTDPILYDSGLLYDSGETYFVPKFQETTAVFSIGRLRQMSLKFAGSSDSTVEAPQLLGQVANPRVGEFALYAVEWLHSPLGLS